MKLHPHVLAGYMILAADGSKTDCNVCGAELKSHRAYSKAPVFSKDGHTERDKHKKNVETRQWSDRKD